jgi:hypothetical protein
MIRHASVEELAKYDEDDLRPRKRARVAAHVSVCVQCSSNHQRLHAVAHILADVSYPPMPEHLSAKISVAIATESAARVASEPATEAGRMDLPQRQRSPRTGFGARLSSPFGLRVAAATGAAVLVAGGGYAIANGLGSASGPSSSAGSAQFSRNAAGRPAIKAGSVLRVNIAGRVEQIKTFHSSADFSPKNFSAQTVAAVNAQKGPAGPASGGHSGIGTAPAPTSNSAAFGGLSSSVPSKGVLQLQSCVSHIASGGTLELVMSAHFEHRGATIIVVRPAHGSFFEAYAVGSACSGTDKDILFSTKLPRL